MSFQGCRCSSVVFPSVERVQPIPREGLELFELARRNTWGAHEDGLALPSFWVDTRGRCVQPPRSASPEGHGGLDPLTVESGRSQSCR